MKFKGKVVYSSDLYFLFYISRIWYKYCWNFRWKIFHFTLLLVQNKICWICKLKKFSGYIPGSLWQSLLKFHHHHHHRVPEGLGVFPVPWSSRWSWSSISLSVVLCFFVLLVDIVVLVLVVCMFPSSVHVVATFSGTVLFPLLYSVLPFFV